VILDFWAKEFSDEPHGPPEIPFTDGADFDGVAISEDGVTWYEVHSLRNLSPNYTYQIVDLDEAIQTYGLSYGPQFKIRFNQYDNESLQSDGIAIDDIRIAGDVADDLSVTPRRGFTSIGDEEGNFVPSAKTYTLINESSSEISWNVDATVDWLESVPTSGTLAPEATAEVSIKIADLAENLPAGVYAGEVMFINTVSGAVLYREVTLRMALTDYVTELFDQKENDLEYMTLTFYPDEANNTYQICVASDKVSDFPVDPSFGTPLTLGDNAFAEVRLAGTDHVRLYGKRHRILYVSSNGYITFEKPDYSFNESVQQHFGLPRVAALFDDLDPSQIGAKVSWKQLTGRGAVFTYENVPEYNQTNSNNFQIEMLFNGVIRMTWLGIDAEDGLVGLSQGFGEPPEFLESDLSGYLPCTSGLMLMGW